MTAASIETTFLPAPALPPGRSNLVVTGFMGTGKSTAGAEAARALGFPFVDLDHLIERRAGRTVKEIFEAEGEAAFRALERTALVDAARLSATVIATGGGAVMHDAEFGELKRSGEVVVLTADPAVMATRVRAGEGRPMLESDLSLEERIKTLHAERAERYAAAGMPIDTSHAIRKSAAGQAVALYRERRERGERSGANGDSSLARIELSGPDSTYPVVIGRGAVSRLAHELCAALPSLVRVALVAENALSGSGGPVAGIAAALSAAGIDINETTVPGGEAGKRLDTVASMWDAFRGAGLSRSDAVVAVGGGATLDAVGFAAATYARGVPLVNVPTTLLAMVDASLGGKVAIDHGDAKNLVGAFHHPTLVVADPALLDSLPDALARHGLAEAVKEAVLASPAMLDMIDTDALGGTGLPGHLDWIVEQAVRIKAAYVAADPADRGLRHSLNLGHTFAHAIESASGYAVAHGDAVAIGTVAAARLGERLGPTQPGTAVRLRATFARLGLPTDPPEGLDLVDLAAAAGSDKKRRGGRSVFIVPAAGGAALIEGLDPMDALRALWEGADS
jgi:shikimate kinase / 3-dehydroquinate synthase